MLVRTPGASVGLSSEALNLVHVNSRPYLHMYTSSNELEEVGIVSLNGMNIECDSNKEVLFGVRNFRCR
ncbi:hypothetical protein JVU11DRAFT_1255 [Chiua virens]|nr:hypothetical protein JVU11DRAFT_1255 [Chiua virens]